MMNRGVLESSPVQHLTAAGNPNWWNNVSGGLVPPPPGPPQLPPCTTTNLLPNVFPNFFHSTTTSSSSLPSLPPTSNPNFSSWLYNSNDLSSLDQPWSLSQLLLSGLMMGEEERMDMVNHHQDHEPHSYQENKLENWEEQVLRQQASIKKEINNDYGYVMMSSPNSPLNKSRVTTTTAVHNINEDNNNINHSCLKHSEKPKLQVHSLLPSSQSTFKVRKDKLGDRIAVLHQLVSPFAKNDAASVLSEAIGYIRFLHSQIELMNEYHMKISKGASLSSTNNLESNLNEEPKKDLRSRGLCVVPISSTLQVDSDNGADYLAPTFGITFR